MINYLSNKLEQWCETGVKWPFAHDPVTKKPSVTLMFPYIMFMLLIVSIILLHFYPSMIVASTFTGIIWTVSVVFYQLRKLTKAKFDIDDGSFSLDSGRGKE